MQERKLSLLDWITIWIITAVVTCVTCGNAYAQVQYHGPSPWAS